jgi:hypothetical protein
MRNRILAGVGIAALATVGLAAPANAFTPGTADLYIVHAFPATATIADTTVDINIGDGAILLPDVPEGVAAGPGLAAPGLAVPALGNIAPGSYNVEILLDADNTQVLFDANVTLEANKSYTAVAYPAVGGAFSVKVFENDLSAAAGNGLITVRHTADVTPVNVFSGTTKLAGPLANGAEGVLEVPAATYTDVNAGAAATDRNIVLGDVVLPAATNIFVHAFGPHLSGTPTFSAVVFSIGGLTVPTGVPAGSAGLVAEGAPLNGVAFGGVAALMLALMAAVAVVVRRRTAAVER